jgi:argininosuccinate lyase
MAVRISGGGRVTESLRKSIGMTADARRKGETEDSTPAAGPGPVAETGCVNEGLLRRHDGQQSLGEEPMGARAETGTGRLARPPDPALFELLYRPQFLADAVDALPWLLQIDAVHVVMLARQDILPRAAAAALLELNRELAERAARGEPVLEPPPVHRGLYLVYESRLIDRLGSEIGGAAHAARSRNDINAAIARLRARQQLLDLLDAGLEMLASALAVAARHAATVMSGFSHFQPAQPATFGHYLAGVGAELFRSLDWLAAAYDTTNRSPMGAGAGFGTSLPIDQELTAALLGFDGVVGNSLDAVASRDYAVMALSALGMLGITLTRLALDLQLWSSQAYGFLRWPDDLVSTSSMMPQKRNVFMLENLRGQAARPAGALVAALLGMKNTPFGNGVEAGSEAVSHLWPACTAAKTSVRLAALALDRVEVDATRMREFLAVTETTMTALADHLLARHGFAFRTAHEAVGRLLRGIGQGEVITPALVKSGLEEILREMRGHAVVLDEAELGCVLDPQACVHAARHGGGPSPESVLGQLATLERGSRGLAERVASCRRRLADAELRRTAAVGALLAGGQPG